MAEQNTSAEFTSAVVPRTMEFEALAKGSQNGCLHIPVAPQPIVGLNDPHRVFGTCGVLTPGCKCGQGINASLDPGFQFSSFRTRLLRSPHPM